MSETKSDQRLKIENELFTRQRNYKAIFPEGAPVAEDILKDLAKFCRANESTIVPGADLYNQAVLEGRRQVYLRIEQHLKLTSQELYKLFTGQDY